MRAAVPRLEDYDVSPVTGFLPDAEPVRRLSDPYYDPWEDLAENLPALILTRRLRGLVNKLPLLTTEKLKSEPEWRRACVVLGFMAHGYVWGGDAPSDHLPKQIAEPWVKVAEHLELPAIVTYAMVCLWNFKTLVPSDPSEWDLDNLATLNTFTGCIDESWFYLVSTTIERQGAPCLTAGLDAIKACRDNDADRVVECLQFLAESIDAINTTLGRMYEMCDPHTFFFRIRPYLAGWKNMADAGLPNGVRYGDETEYRAISGGSNAQSSLIQALDILLDIEHHPTGERPNSDRFTKSAQGERSKNRNNFIYEMRTYMPGPHRRFLEALSQVSEIREFVTTNAEQTPALVISYDACLAMLRAFRDKHIQVVSRYIILQAREAERRKQPSLTKREGLAAAKSSDQNGKSKPKRGTGGTALIPFLKQARDETGDPAASSWGKRLLSDNMAIIGKRNRHIFSSSSDEETPEDAANKAVRTNERELKIGLNGSWEVEEDTHKSIMHW